MVADVVFPPFEPPELSRAQAFADHMMAAVGDAALGAFDTNLWGLAVTTELATETVDAYLYFDSEPSDLDRFEISEFKFGFGAATGGSVELRIHRTVMDRGAFVPVFGASAWLLLRRHPGAGLPDDVGFDELDY